MPVTPATQNAEAGGSQIRNQPGLHREFQASLAKKQNKKQTLKSPFSMILV
jgi:hypothetical protein